MVCLAFGQGHLDRHLGMQQVGVVDVLHLDHRDIALRIVLKTRPEGVTHLYFSQEAKIHIHRNADTTQRVARSYPTTSADFKIQKRRYCKFLLRGKSPGAPPGGSRTDGELLPAASRQRAVQAQPAPIPGTSAPGG